MVLFLALIIWHHDILREKSGGPWFPETKPKLPFIALQKHIVSKQVNWNSAYDGRILLICVKNDGSASCLQVSGGEGGPCITQKQLL